HFYRALGDPVWKAIGLNCYGWDLAKFGRLDEARQHCREALELFRQWVPSPEQANTLDSLGFIELGAGNHEESIAYYRQSLALYRELGNRLGVSEETVKTHIRRILRKLEARARAHAVARAFHAGVLPPR
ncbi:tetratricopeptide repeat protein, partial [Cellulomonas oligotrophica]|uniref:tetratricopeptide repeat protein n=1 Tax=Cellulomonas oligotrophica TaxID=931536 RepID=UPI0031E64C35